MGKSWSSRDVLRELERAGFVRVGQRGSHVKLRDAQGRTVIVAHPTKDIPRGTLRSIERQAGIEFD
jgi:predicted RNA binding protein YcfA (HicA-like mRNA interferase family)